MSDKSSEGSESDFDAIQQDIKCDDIKDINSPKTPLIKSVNPCKWDWKLIKLWLNERDLSPMIVVLNYYNNNNIPIDGEILLSIDFDKLWRDYNIGDILNIASRKEAIRDALIKRFLRELTELKLRSISKSGEISQETTIYDVIEMERRIKEFTDKWDCVLWIEHYVETNNKTPTKEIISSELETSISKGLIYLDYFENMNKFKEKDLNELLLDFNVYNDCIIWWYIIISKLKSYPSKSLWLIFAKIAEITPHKICIELLQIYEADLTRFEADELHKVTRNIVVGSQYPICTALRIAKWFKDRAEFDVARGEIFKNMALSYIEAAIDHLSIIQSDHLATVLLETPSDIDDGLSAMEMALEYELTSFVAKSRVERVVTSVMNDWEFLRPKNRAEAFEINPVSIKLVWNKMFMTEFYLTPLGTFITTMVLYFAYLGLFTYLSFETFEVYDKLRNSEIAFWIFNIGYVLFEIHAISEQGVASYYRERENYFDTFISILFVADLAIRIYGSIHRKTCGELNDCSMDALHTIFVVLWGAATIALWLRCVIFCVFSRNLGPMVQMIFRMMDDISTFFEIMIILFAGFTFALSFIMGDIHDDFKSPDQAALTLFMAALGDFDFDEFKQNGDDESVNEILVFCAHMFVIAYLIIASLVLLNILIAMMAKTFENIHESSTTAIIFSRFKLAWEKSEAPSYMPPPLNVLAMPLVVVFYCIEIPFNWIRKLFGYQNDYDMTLLLMPSFMKRRKLEIDEQLLYENCHRYWKITTNEGLKRCKMMKYNATTMKHYVEFYDLYENEKVSVSVQNRIEKRKRFWLDLFELKDDGLIDFEQFNNIEITQQWVQNAQNVREEMRTKRDTQDMDTIHDYYCGPYWICSFCRRHVEESRVSIKRLGKELKISAVEMALIHKIEPVICPHCYRKRKHLKRNQLVWEIIALWTWY